MGLFKSTYFPALNTCRRITGLFVVLGGGREGYFVRDVDGLVAANANSRAFA